MQSMFFESCENRKLDLQRTGPSISPHTALTLHLVCVTEAMLCGSKGGGFEIGELTSISTPGRLAGWPTGLL